MVRTRRLSSRLCFSVKPSSLASAPKRDQTVGMNTSLLELASPSLFTCPFRLFRSVGTLWGLYSPASLRALAAAPRHTAHSRPIRVPVAPLASLSRARRCDAFNVSTYTSSAFLLILSPPCCARAAVPCYSVYPCFLRAPASPFASLPRARRCDALNASTYTSSVLLLILSSPCCARTAVPCHSVYLCFLCAPASPFASLPHAHHCALLQRSFPPLLRCCRSSLLPAPCAPLRLTTVYIHSSSLLLLHILLPICACTAVPRYCIRFCLLCALVAPLVLLRVQ